MHVNRWFVSTINNDNIYDNKIIISPIFDEILTYINNKQKKALYSKYNDILKSLSNNKKKYFFSKNSSLLSKYGIYFTCVTGELSNILSKYKMPTIYTDSSYFFNNVIYASLNSIFSLRYIIIHSHCPSNVNPSVLFFGIFFFEITISSFLFFFNNE